MKTTARRMIWLTFGLLWTLASSAEIWENVAPNGVATQSSTLDGLTSAKKAIDGNLDNNYHFGSCAHTGNDVSPWWKVDLLQPHTISKVVITNRGDCCWEQLTGASILIGNYVENNGNNNPSCAEIYYIQNSGALTFQCNMVGRYVKIIIRGKQQPLTLCEVQVFGVPLGENVAPNGVASQSSTLDGLTSAKNAIDGNLDNNYHSSSCAHTGNDVSPWWRVDLLQPHTISKVVITNRGDCCWERLTGASILIGNSTENNGNNNPSCAEISFIQNSGALTFQCNYMVGRYVNIVIRGKQRYLQLCEVQVFGVPFPVTIGGNVALNGVASQSSTLDGQSSANKAIDGNLDTYYFSGSCTHTRDDVSPWWRVDLLQSHLISKIIIINRGDCCWDRLTGASILIGNSVENNGNNNPSCAEIISIQDSDAVTILCWQMVGRYVNIVIKGKRQSLTLCEVQVFGEPLGENVALNCEASQSSTYDGAISTANKAIDGNLDTNYHSGSCSHTNDDVSPWWRVDLLQPHKISTVVITNRADCCRERLNGASILIGNSLENNGNNNPRCAVISSIQTNGALTFQCNDMVGQYVNIVIRGKHQPLALCEVQVFGVPLDGNIALHGIAYQSSNDDAQNTANKAIDGNLNTLLFDGSCSVTRYDISPWWRLELRWPYKISKVIIISDREFWDYMVGASILIGNNPGNDGNLNPRCAVISSIQNSGDLSFKCNNMVGQYVNIANPYKQKPLVLCEVQVFGVRATRSEIAAWGQIRQ
ncbi:uncharacterized protein [Hyperolius riggenbachi]|uniref:uncharacterized protein n=1 Tax=Hyperolius riggenbachi TaxID=752182 RepID=UPI0035A2F8F6